MGPLRFFFVSLLFYVLLRLVVRLMGELAAPRRPRVIYDRRHYHERRQRPGYPGAPDDPRYAPPPPPPRPAAARARSPHEVLGVAPGAPPAAVRAAYQALVRQYHPDQLSHLAPELRELAERRTKEINAAYNALKRGA